MTIITLALVWKRHTGQRELRIRSESMTGKKESDWRRNSRSATTTTSFEQSNPNQNYPLRCIGTQPRAQTE
jgi:hypothetical protein